MDRLTIRNSDGSVSQPTDMKWAEALERLADYEDMQEKHHFDIENERFFCEVMEKVNIDRFMEIMDAEEQGRLVVLPCKVGDILYAPTRNFVSTFRVTQFDFGGADEPHLFVEWRLVDGITGTFRLYGIDAAHIGKRVFLTREEAETALKRKCD